MKGVIFENEIICPSKIICVGRNYTKHIEELGNKNPEEIVFFIKPNSSISTQLIKPDKKCRYEGEISFIFRKGQVAGVGFGIDLTLVEEQNRLKSKGLPWEKAKAFDNSVVFSKFVRIEPQHINSLKMELWINGQLRQSGSVADMIYKPENIIKEMKKYFSVYDGDILMCGTPSGVGEFEKGDIFTGKIFIDNKPIIEAQWTAK